MRSEILKKYIQFAMDNGFYVLSSWEIIKDIYQKFSFPQEWRIEIKSDCGNRAPKSNFNLYELVQRRDFIEAITKGFRNKIISETDQVNNFDRSFEQCLDRLTYKQALAIRDGKLEEFIKNILNIKENE